MTGLAGIVDSAMDQDKLESLLKRMCASIAHGDWFHTSTYANSAVGLGRVSLGILNPGPQPIFNRTRSLCIVMDGEIYNRDRLSQLAPLDAKLGSDPELLLHLYQRLGPGFVRHINGSFAFSIWDRAKQTLLLVSDRTGSRPIYYADTGCFIRPGPTANGRGRLLFASEVKALLQDRRIRWTIDDRAVADFVTFQMLLGDKTFFREIKVLPPATVLTCHTPTYWVDTDGRAEQSPGETDTIQMEQYWDVSFKGDRLSEEATIDGLAFHVRQAVERQMSHRMSASAGLPTVGVYLSGGLDSRVLLGAIDSRHYPLPTFTQGIPGSNDVRFAAKMAEHVGSDHHYVRLEPNFFSRCAETNVWLTDGMCSVDHMNRLNILKLSRQHCQAAFDGLAGGTIPGGTHIYQEHLIDMDREQLARLLYREFAAVFSDGLWSAHNLLFSPGYLPKVEGAAYASMKQEVEKTPTARPANMIERVYLRNRQRRFSAFGPLLTRSQLECRTPFCDNDLLDFSFSIPSEMRMGKRLLRALLEREFPALARVPWAFSGIPVSATTPTRTFIRRSLYKVQRELRDTTYKMTSGRVVLPYKREYQDIAYWLRTDLRPWVEGILLSSTAMDRGILNPQTVRQLLDEHMRCKRDHTRRLCTLVTLELWHRQFIDQAPTYR